MNYIQTNTYDSLLGWEWLWLVLLLLLLLVALFAPHVVKDAVLQLLLALSVSLLLLAPVLGLKLLKLWGVEESGSECESVVSLGWGVWLDWDPDKLVVTWQTGWDQVEPLSDKAVQLGHLNITLNLCNYKAAIKILKFFCNTFGHGNLLTSIKIHHKMISLH